MLQELHTNPGLKGVGHITRSWKQDEEAMPVVLHYFYIVLGSPNAIPSEKVFELVTLARQVIPLPKILPAVFDAYRLVAAVNLKEESGTNCVSEDPALQDAVVIQVPTSLDTLSELGDALLKLVGKQSEEVASKSVVLVVSAPTTSAHTDASASSARSGGQLRFPNVFLPKKSGGAEGDEGESSNSQVVPSPTLATPDLLRLVFRLCWDYLVLPCCIVAKEAEVQQLAGLHKKPIRWDTVSPLVSTLSCFATRHLKTPADGANTMRLFSATVPSETQLTVVKQPDLTTVLPVTSRTGTPFNVGGGCLTSVEDLTSYQIVKDLIQLVAPQLDTPRDSNGDTSNVKRLRRSNLKEATANIAREGYRLRRTCLGEQVLVVVDSLQNIFLVDAATKSFIVALPTWRSNNNTPLAWSGNLSSASNCVLQATLVPSFRNEGQYKVIVEDVLLWNSNSMADRSLEERLQEIEATSLEEEHQWAAPSPLGIVVLRSSYFRLDKGAQLLNTFVSEHPTQGLTFVPTHHTSQPTTTTTIAGTTAAGASGSTPTTTTTAKAEGKKLPTYTWQLPESCTINFLAAALEDVSEEAGITQSGAPIPTSQKINRMKLQTLNSDNAGAATATADSFYESYNNEYVDYLVPTAPGVSQSSTVQCLLIREADGAHWWEVITEFSAFDRALVDTKQAVDSLVHDPNLSSEDVHWLCTAQGYLCQECHEVDEQGADDTSVHKFYCRKCWEKYGFGDCRSCPLRFTPGTVDQATNKFYCKTCWGQFMTPHQQGGGGNGVTVPAPRTAGGGAQKVALNMPHTPTSPNAPDGEPLGTIAKEGLAPHLLTLAHKVLIDAAATHLSTAAPTDVLELNCGSSANLKRWVEVGVQNYFGADISTTLLDEARHRAESILQHYNAEQEQPGAAAGSETSEGAATPSTVPHVEHLCGDVYHGDFWASHIHKARSTPFHVITCHQGLHSPILLADGRDAKASVSGLIAGVSASLVPNGIFMALILDAGDVHKFLIANGSESTMSGYHCPVFSIEHTTQPHHEFSLSLNPKEEQQPSAEEKEKKNEVEEEEEEDKTTTTATENGDATDVIKRTSKQRLQAADATTTILQVAKDHDLTPCAAEVSTNNQDKDTGKTAEGAEDAQKALPYLSEFLLSSERGKDVATLLASATEEEKTLFSFFRVLLLRKGAVSAPLAEPTNK